MENLNQRKDDVEFTKELFFAIQKLARTMNDDSNIAMLSDFGGMMLVREGSEELEKRRQDPAIMIHSIPGREDFVLCSK